MGYVPRGEQGVQLHWRLLADEEMPDDALNRDHLKTVYRDIPFKTGTDIERRVRKHSRIILVVKCFTFITTIIVPLIVLIAPEISRPVAVIALAYGLVVIVVKMFKQTGILKKSTRDLEREKEELEIRHHHYHCKRNPQGFLRLKCENFEREERERTRKEHEALKL